MTQNTSLNQYTPPTENVWVLNWDYETGEPNTYSLEGQTKTQIKLVSADGTKHIRASKKTGNVVGLNSYHVQEYNPEALSQSFEVSKKVIANRKVRKAKKQIRKNAQSIRCAAKVDTLAPAIQLAPGVEAYTLEYTYRDLPTTAVLMIRWDQSESYDWNAKETRLRWEAKCSYTHAEDSEAKSGSLSTVYSWTKREALIALMSSFVD